MELWDLYDKNRIPLGKTHKRGENLPSETYHQVVGIWTVHTSGKILLTKRAYTKEVCPGKWENTGGSVLSGETSITASQREVFEETGLNIPLENFHFLDTIKTHEAFIDSYIALTSLPMEAVSLQENETIDYQWLTLSELHTLVYTESFASPIVKQYEKSKNKLEKILKQYANLYPSSSLKEEANALFDELGLSFETAITLFLKQALRTKSLPFLPSLSPSSLTNESLANNEVESDNMSYNQKFDASIGVDKSNEEKYHYTDSNIKADTPSAHHFFDSMARFALGNYKKEEN